MSLAARMANNRMAMAAVVTAIFFRGGADDSLFMTNAYKPVHEYVDPFPHRFTTSTQCGRLFFNQINDQVQVRPVNERELRNLVFSLYESFFRCLFFFLPFFSDRR
jgi:hypothetical protein